MKKSIKTKLILAVSLIMLVSFLVTGLSAREMMKQEVLSQWKNDYYNLVVAYSKSFTVENAQEFVDEINEDITLNYALYISTDLKAVAHSNHDRIGIDLDDAGSIAAARDGQSFVGFFTDPVTNSRTLDILTPMYENGELIGALNIGVPVSEQALNATVNKRFLMLMAEGFGLLLLFAGILLLVIHKEIIQPIGILKYKILRLADYDLSEEENQKKCIAVSRADELGSINRAIGTMRGNFIDLTSEIKEISDHLTATSTELAQISKDTEAASQHVAAAMDEIAAGTGNQAEQTMSGAESVDKLDQSIENTKLEIDKLNHAIELISTIKTSCTRDLEDLMNKTNANQQDAMGVEEVIGQTSDKVGQIESASQKIKEISSQTNLLALNASIEAARAGDAGLGFAVVASEITNLSNQTDQFANEIMEVIRELVEKIQDAVASIEKMRGTADAQTTSAHQSKYHVDEIAEQLDQIMDSFTVLENAGEEMRSDSGELDSVMKRLSGVSQNNAAATEEVSAAVEQQAAYMNTIMQSSAVMSKMSDKIKQCINQFQY